MDKKVDGYNVDGDRVTWHSHGVSYPQGDKYNVDGGKVMWPLRSLSSPQETSKGNILRLTINIDQQNHYMEKIL